MWGFFIPLGFSPTYQGFNAPGELLTPFYFPLPSDTQLEGECWNIILAIQVSYPDNHILYMYILYKYT